MSPGESLLGVPNDKVRARIRLVGLQVLRRGQITVAVGIGVLIRAAIRHVGKQVPLVVVRVISSYFVFYGVHLKTNSQVCGHVYSNRNSQAHLVKFGTDPAIDHIG